MTRDNELTHAGIAFGERICLHLEEKSLRAARQLKRLRRRACGCVGESTWMPRASPLSFVYPLSKSESTTDQALLYQQHSVYYCAIMSQSRLHGQLEIFELISPDQNNVVDRESFDGSLLRGSTSLVLAVSDERLWNLRRKIVQNFLAGMRGRIDVVRLTLPPDLAQGEVEFLEPDPPWHHLRGRVFFVPRVKELISQNWFSSQVYEANSADFDKVQIP